MERNLEKKVEAFFSYKFQTKFIVLVSDLEWIEERRIGTKKKGGSSSVLKNHNSSIFWHVLCFNYIKTKNNEWKFLQKLKNNLKIWESGSAKKFSKLKTETDITSIFYPWLKFSYLRIGSHRINWTFSRKSYFLLSFAEKSHIFVALRPKTNFKF